MLFKAYLLASLPFITSTLGAVIPEVQTLGVSIEKMKSYCPDLLNANSDTLKLGLAGISIPRVAKSFQLWTSVDIVKAYNKRIDETQSTLNAVLERNPDAVSFAATLDAERRAGKLRSPLHGLPILLKDTIATGDKMNNTAGSFALLRAQVGESTISKKLKAAGVIVLGKSTLSQWSNFRSVDETQGWTAIGGQSLGAYVANQNPRGSSSGSAIGSSVGLAWASIGIETAGSIVVPSSYNNVVGMKPTVGLTSRWLTIGTSPRQDSVGPIARTVSDAAALLQVIAGKDSNDPYTVAQPFASPPDYMKALNKDSLRGKRIGIPRNVLADSLNPALGVFQPGQAAAILEVFNEAVKAIEAAGATVVDNTNFTSWEEYVNDLLTNPLPFSAGVIAVDFYAELPKYLAQLKTNPNNITNLETLRDFTQNFPLEQAQQKNTGLWDQVLFALSAYPTLRQDSADFAYFTETTRRWANEEGITGAMAKYKVDGFILPSTYSDTFSSLGGMPIISVPMGKYSSETPEEAGIDGLVDSAPNMPIGVSFFAEKWSEEKLLGWAYAFEQKTQWRNKVIPVVKPMTQLWDVLLKQ